MNNFIKYFISEIEKEAKMIAMTYDPKNKNILELKKKHGDSWKNVLAKQKGISPDSIYEKSKSPFGF